MNYTPKSYETDDLSISLPEKDSIIQSGEYQKYFMPIDQSLRPNLLMHFARFNKHIDRAYEFVWGARIDRIPGEYSGELERILNLYNEIEMSRKFKEDITGYFSFQWEGDNKWYPYCTPQVEDAENEAYSVVVTITEEEAYSLAKVFVEIGCIDINHLIF